MIRRRRCKCCHCGQLYQTDPRNGYHQRYCSQPDCRKASKLHSQQRWRASPQGKDYFKGSANVHRVRAWRVAHPGYWRNGRKTSTALQDHCEAQPIAPKADTHFLTDGALQDLILVQGLLLIGLTAQLAGSTLQENIASTTQRLIGLGRQIQGNRRQAHGQTSVMPGAIAASAIAVQLDRPPPGAG